MITPLTLVVIDEKHYYIEFADTALWESHNVEWNKREQEGITRYINNWIEEWFMRNENTKIYAPDLSKY